MEAWIIAAIICIAVAGIVFWAERRPKNADGLEAAEAEDPYYDMGKVTKNPTPEFDRRVPRFPADDVLESPKRTDPEWPFEKRRQIPSGGSD